jgi:hypothetical protein
MSSSRRLDLKHRTGRSGVHVFKLDLDVVIELSQGGMESMLERASMKCQRPAQIRLFHAFLSNPVLTYTLV